MRGNSRRGIYGVQRLRTQVCGQLKNAATRIQTMRLIFSERSFHPHVCKLKNLFFSLSFRVK